MYELTAVTKEENFAPLKRILENRGANLVSEETPKKIHLFYPIKKERYGFLGIFRFESVPEALGPITSDLNLDGNVLRFFLLKSKEAKNTESDKPVKPVSREFSRAAAVKKPAETALTNEELEKKIEEILK